MSGYILVVDDDVGMQLTIARILEDAGYEIDCADNGHQALEQVEQRRPDLIVLDLAMPEMNGYAFAEELERRGLRPATPILVVTADGQAAEKAARMGAEGHLAKPFELLALLAEVDYLMQRSDL